MKVAQNYKDKVTFAVSNKDKFSAEVEDYGLDTKGDKPVAAARNAANQKFNMKDEFRYIFTVYSIAFSNFIFWISKNLSSICITFTLWFKGKNTKT